MSTSNTVTVGLRSLIRNPPEGLTGNTNGGHPRVFRFQRIRPLPGGARAILTLERPIGVGTAVRPSRLPRPVQSARADVGDGGNVPAQAPSGDVITSIGPTQVATSGSEGTAEEQTLWEGYRAMIANGLSQRPVFALDGVTDNSYSPPVRGPGLRSMFITTHDQLQTKLRTEAAQHEMDVDFYCYLVVKGLFTGRSLRRWAELKAKAETWLLANRSDWTSLRRTAELLRGMRLLQTMNVGDRLFVESLRSEWRWTVDGPLSQTHRLNDFARQGILPTYGLLGRWFFRWRSVPVQ